MQIQNSKMYACQKCHLPIIIDSSLINLSNAQSELLKSSKVTQPSFPPVVIPPERRELLERAQVDSYVLLNSGDTLPDDVKTSIEGHTGTLSTKVSHLSSLFNTLSCKYSIDYPICQECSEILIQKMKEKYDTAIQRRDVYFKFLDRLKRLPASERKEADEIELLKQKEEELLDELYKIEEENEEKEKAFKEQKKVHENEVELRTNEQLFQNLKDLEMLRLNTHKKSLENQNQYIMNQLDKLRKTNILHEVFNISHNGPFGTINGLRLGSLEEIRVPWQEINAAVGQLVLLLASVSEKLEISIEGYKLHPMGSNSSISRLENGSFVIYEAYSHGDYKITRLFTHNSLDTCLVCMLDIISQFASHLSNMMNETMELPYKMSKDTINGLSIRLNSNTADLSWTTACKFLLTNAKWILAYSSASLSS